MIVLCTDREIPEEEESTRDGTRVHFMTTSLMFLQKAKLMDSLTR